MKVILSLKDVNEAVRKVWSLPDDAEIVIENTNSLVSRIESALSSIPDIASNKIARIKALREASRNFRYEGWVWGLAESKHAIENYHKFMWYVTRNGEFPKDDTYYR